ncbi:MAG TPA: hypothetical protein VG759_26205 [Candidatus Angelobacter sp.]|jgi:hypothetical protein|nr:hypothetical protein [Candidatus Angelobacter sp.]
MSTIQTAAATAARDLLRHTIATVAYRASTALHDAPESFAEFKPSPDGRTPAQILAHMGDLYDWVLSLCKGKQAWHDSTPLPWPQEVQRFFQSLQAVEDYLASDQPLGCPPEKLLQGGISDSLTHIGQINMLRRTVGCPIKRETISGLISLPDASARNRVHPEKKSDIYDFAAFFDSRFFAFIRGELVLIFSASPR